MRIQYAQPLTQAVERMKTILFKPFDLALWLAVGLSSFLANMGGGNGGSHSRGMINNHDEVNGLHDILYWPYQAWDWITDNPGWTLLIGFGLIFFIGLAILLTWLSSKGKFCFVHNVATGTGEISKPWKAYGPQANSLTVWRLVFGVAAMITIGLIVVQIVIASGVAHSSDLFGSVSIVTIIGMGLLLLAAIFAISLVAVVLDNFVVPIMYKHQCSATEAWHRFTPLLKAHLGHIVLYLLMVLGLNILVAVVVMTVGLMTCCIGFIFLMIPYVGSVVLLPISVSLRGFSLTFLAQFGPEFDLLNPLEIHGDQA